MSLCFSPDALDALLADHDVLADIDETIATIRTVGLAVQPALIRDRLTLDEIDPGRVEFLCALIDRRLTHLKLGGADGHQT